MKRKLLVFTFLVSISWVANGQTPATAKPKTFIIKLHTGKKTAYGYLAGMNDSMIKFSRDRTVFSDSILENSSFHTYRYYEIEKAGIRKYGSLRKGIIIGGLVGATFGSLLEPVVNNSLTFSLYGSPATSSGGSGNIITGSIIGLITGAIIGALAGKAMRKFYIHRNKKKFIEMKGHFVQMFFKPSTEDSSIIY